MTALWTGGGGGPPDEYTDLVLCRDIFHCPPSVLDEQDDDRVLMMLACYNAEQKVKEMRASKGSKRGRASRRLGGRRR